MADIVETLAGTPIPTILVVAGILFLLLSVADKVSGQLSVSEQRKKYAMIAGIVLIVAGLAINMLQTQERNDKKTSGNPGTDQPVEPPEQPAALMPTTTYALNIFSGAVLEIGNTSNSGIIIVRDLTLWWEYSECQDPRPRVEASLREMPEYKVEITKTRGSKLFVNDEFEYPPAEVDKFGIYIRYPPGPGIYTIWIEFDYRVFPSKKSSVFKTEKKVVQKGCSIP